MIDASHFKATTDVLEGKVFPNKLEMPSGTISSFGITKRELFAAMAMQGIYASSRAWPNRQEAAYLSEIAVATADALLKELNK